jgi:hypothetical protein
LTNLIHKLQSLFGRTLQNQQTMVKEASSFWRTVGLILLVGVLCLLNPSGFRWLPFHWPYELVSRLGEALIISAVLAATVELYTRKRMMRQVVLDVFQYIAGHPLPNQLKDRIKKLVRTDLIRKDLRLRYDFEELDGNRLTVTLEIEFKLENISSAEEPFQQRLEAEAHDSPRVLSMCCVSSEKAASYELSNVELKESESDPRAVFAEGKKIRIRPNRDIPAITYVIKGKFQFVFPADFSDVFSSLLPTVGTTVVEVGEAPENLEIFISDYRAKHVARLRWEFNEAFTRSEHFRIRWYRTKTLLQ